METRKAAALEPEPEPEPQPGVVADDRAGSLEPVLVQEYGVVHLKSCLSEHGQRELWRLTQPHVSDPAGKATGFSGFSISRKGGKGKRVPAFDEFGSLVFGLCAEALSTALCEEGQASGDLYWRPDIVDSAAAPAAAAKKAAKATEGDDLWSRESLDQEMNYLLEIAPQLVDYHMASVSGDERVHSRLQSPDELAATFVEAGAELELKENADPVDMDGIKRAVHAVMDNSVRSSHPLSLNQLYSGVDPVALAGEWIASTLNANVHTFEVAPVLTEIEKAVLAKTARMWLAPGSPAATPKHDGLIVPGGSLSNLYSMILARDRAELRFVEALVAPPGGPVRRSAASEPRTPQSLRAAYAAEPPQSRVRRCAVRVLLVGMLVAVRTPRCQYTAGRPWHRAYANRWPAARCVSPRPHDALPPTGRRTHARSAARARAA